MYGEDHRPLYHFTVRSGWQNDPNGLVYMEGEYHLFYQYNPLHNGFGPMNWGHAVSRDLLHWEELPVAIEWDKKGYIWSGSAVVDEADTSGLFGGGRGLVAFFTYADDDENQSIALAYSRDRGRTWTKYAGNPLLRDDGEKAFRDPKVFWYAPAGRWIMVVAGGPVRFYSSADLIDWRFESRNDIWTECPDFFELPIDGEGRSCWVLDRAGKGAVFGDFDGKVFTPWQNGDEVTWSPDRYAAQTFNQTPDGRRIELSWFGSWRYQEHLTMRGMLSPFNGGVTLPVELSCRRGKDGAVRLMKKPIPEIDRLHDERIPVVMEGGEKGGLRLTVPDRAADCIATFSLGTAAGFCLRIAWGEGTISAGYDAGGKCFFVDRRDCGLELPGFCERVEAPFIPDENGEITLRLFIDRCMLEFFDGEGAWECAAWMPAGSTQPLALEAAFYGGEGKIHRFDAWTMKRIWKGADNRAAEKPLRPTERAD